MPEDPALVPQVLATLGFRGGAGAGRVAGRPGSPAAMSRGRTDRQQAAGGRVRPPSPGLLPVRHHHTRWWRSRSSQSDVDARDPRSDYRQLTARRWEPPLIEFHLGQRQWRAWRSSVFRFGYTSGTARVADVSMTFSTAHPYRQRVPVRRFNPAPCADLRAGAPFRVGHRRAESAGLGRPPFRLAARKRRPLGRRPWPPRVTGTNSLPPSGVAGAFEVEACRSATPMAGPVTMRAPSASRSGPYDTLSLRPETEAARRARRVR